MLRSICVSAIRRKARRLGYRLVKARSIRWEGTQWTDPYRLIDCDNGLYAAGFDTLEEVSDWLND